MREGKLAIMMCGARGRVMRSMIVTQYLWFIGIKYAV